MARSIDGFVLPVPKKNLKAYVRLARMAGKVWKEHGALEYRECIGDELDVEMGMPFPRPAKQLSSRGSSTSRAPIVTASMRRS